MATLYYLTIVVALMCLFRPSYQIDAKEARVALVKKCQEKTGAPDADIQKLRDGKAPETKEGLCMFECFLDNSKVMQDGKYSKEGLITASTPLMKGDAAKIEGLKKMADTCGKEIEGATGDKCATAQKLMHCTAVEGEKFGFVYPKDF